VKKLTLIFVICFVTALCAASASAQSDTTAPPSNQPDETEKEASALIDSWEIVINAQGQDLFGKLKIAKDGDEFKGSVVTDMGEAPLKNISIKDDDTFTADITAYVQGQVFEGTVNGKLIDQKLTGEINLAGLGPISYSGKKPEKK
jgi:hypothetical protein